DNATGARAGARGVDPQDWAHLGLALVATALVAGMYTVVTRSPVVADTYFCRGLAAWKTSDTAPYVGRCNGLQLLLIPSERSTVDALDNLQRAVALLPQFPDGQNWLGWMYANLQDLDKATVAYRAARAANPEWASPGVGLAHAFLLRDKYNEAY